MEREDRINNAAHQLYNDYAYRSLLDIFKFGAKWADENREEGWIDIKDMKPEDIMIDANTWVYTEPVLVLAYDKDIQIANRYWDNKHEKWGWNVSPLIGERITHWMPLPKAI